MFSDALTEELDAKATQTALSAETATRESAVEAEMAARKGADAELDTRVGTMEEALPTK